MTSTISCNGIFPNRAGLSGYIAEMAGAFVCASFGIVPTIRHADYIGSWLEKWRARHYAERF
jgi:antirestriction protein ArdC